MYGVMVPRGYLLLATLTAAGGTLVQLRGEVEVRDFALLPGVSV